MGKKLFLGLFMLFVTISTFAQEVTKDGWSYGVETSFGLTSGYSASIQGMVENSITGLSLDWIHTDTEYSGGVLGGRNGVLGSLFLGVPFIGGIFGPYIGGGLGIGFADENAFFAWKADAGLSAKLVNDFWHLKAGVMYDNVREGFSITAGVGLKLYKHVTSTYRNEDGSTFPRTWKRFFWQSTSTPNSIYNSDKDVLVSREVVNRYRKTTNTSTYTPAKYEYKTTGGELVFSQNSFGTISVAATEKKTEYVKTKEAKETTYFYVHDVTVTRNWYNRTWYYKDRAPTTQRIYQDTESAVLVDKYSRTETR